MRALVALALATTAAGSAATEAPRTAQAATPEAKILVMIRMEPAHFRPDVDYGHGYAARAGLAARQRTAQAIARTHGLQVLSHWPMPAIGVECYEMRVPSEVSVDAALAALAGDGRALWAQPLQTFGSRSYRDPLYDLQPSAGAWHLHQLHEVARGRGVLIAQIDSGVEVDHPDLLGQVHSVENTAGSRYEAEQHGTAVAGIIAARGNNGVGIVGVAPDARLFAVRACRERVAGRAECDSLSLAKALQLAIDRRAQIVNLSVGGPRDRLLGALLDAAIGRGAIVVAAADADDRDGGFPASHAGVIAVTEARALSPPGAFAAAGAGVPTTQPGMRWGFVSGSSFSAAAVTGVVALLIELRPGAGTTQIDQLLRLRPERLSAGTVAVPLPVDACRSVSLAAGRCACQCVNATVSAAMHPTGPAGDAARPRRERSAVSTARH